MSDCQEASSSWGEQDSLTAPRRRQSCLHCDLSRRGNKYPLFVPLYLQHFVTENIATHIGTSVLTACHQGCWEAWPPLPLGTVFFRVHKTAISLFKSIHNYMLSTTNTFFHQWHSNYLWHPPLPSACSGAWRGIVTRRGWWEPGLSVKKWHQS